MFALVACAGVGEWRRQWWHMAALARVVCHPVPAAMGGRFTDVAVQLEHCRSAVAVHGADSYWPSGQLAVVQLPTQPPPPPLALKVPVGHPVHFGFELPPHEPVRYAPGPQLVV